VAEEQRLRERLRERRGVDDDEGLGRARAARVERPRDLLLAGAGLALDEDCERLGRDALERGEELAHLRRLADELAEGALRADGGDRGMVVEPDAEGGAADEDLAAARELDLGDAVRTEPGAVGAPRVADVDALPRAAELEVHAAHLRVGEDEIVRRVAADGRERARHRERPAGPRPRRRHERGDGRHGPHADACVDLRAAATVLAHRERMLPASDLAKMVSLRADA
jgi:hypothetical protein